MTADDSAIKAMQASREHLLRAWACNMIDRQDARTAIHRLTADIENAAKNAAKDPRVYNYTLDATKRVYGLPTA